VVAPAPAGGHELLGQQVAQPGRRSRPPRPATGNRSPRPGAATPGRVPVAPQLAEAPLGHVGSHRCVRSLVGVHTDHHRHHCFFVVGDVNVTVAGTPASGCYVLARVSRHATLRPSRDALRSKAKPRSTPARRHFESDPARTFERYELTATPAIILKQAHWRHVTPGYDLAFGGTRQRCCALIAVAADSLRREAHPGRPEPAGAESNLGGGRRAVRWRRQRLVLD
jgi:hypothetical protein